MEYTKVGRGGAGNYYSQQDVRIANAEKRPPVDLERQEPASKAKADDVERHRSELAHSGRGGAGNYTDANKLARATAEAANITPSLQETKPPEIGHYGRGGAGNYRSGIDDAGNSEQMKKQSEAQQKAHQQLVKDVETSLKEPEQAHLGATKLE